jgi:D-alanine-D-alanine ligase
MGGLSTEREVSLKTGTKVLENLLEEKYEAYPVDLAAGSALPDSPLSALPAFQRGSRELKEMDGAGALVSQLANGRWPDVVFIALHGKYGEDGTVQGLLELLGLPYTGSGVLASALAIQKAMAKKVLRGEGIPTPDWLLLTEREGAEEAALGFGVPLVTKPVTQGSTIGLSLVRDAEQVPAALDLAFRYDSQVLLERLVTGVEITAAVLGNRELQVLPLIEIVPASGFYDYEAKYTPGATDEIIPARISAEASREAEELAIRSHRALGCRGVSRVDMIVTAEGVTVIEVNTIPGMTETSLLPRAAAAAGIGFPELLDRLVTLAREPR